MLQEFKVSKEERKFYLQNCPLKINQKSFKKDYLHCMAKEKSTRRNILFHICGENQFLSKEIGEVIILASAYQADIVVLIVSETSAILVQVFEWLQKVSDKRTDFILIKTST